MSAQPLTCPLTLDTLLAPNSLLRTTEGWRFPFLVLWTHESLSSRAQSAGPLLRPSGVGVGWAMRRGGPCRSQMCPAQLPGRLLSQHQQLLPQNTWHQRGLTQGSAKPWGRLERRSCLGKAGFQDLHGAPRGLPSSMAQTKTHTPTPRHHTLVPQYQLGARLDFLVRSGPWNLNQVDREVARGNSLQGPETPATTCCLPGLGRSRSGEMVSKPRIIAFPHPLNF